MWSSAFMDNLAQIRLRRLTEYMIEHKMVQDDGKPSPTALAVATGRKTNYCNDLLKGGSKPFGARVARALERELELPAYHLDGVSQNDSWPFSPDLLDQVLALDARDRLQLEGALRLALAQIRSVDGQKKTAA
ncbi:hypothetical protein [Brachymonas wangyanguii]|uniref:hypothetical protein n=1 Tax=Brachymonas wangyanguii TaxID=3130163 RepID=UPI00307DC5C8